MPTVVVKKKCCKDTPRCRRCPVVLKRLSDEGYAERESRREYTIPKKLAKKLPKKVLAAARAR